MCQKLAKLKLTDVHLSYFDFQFVVNLDWKNHNLRLPKTTAKQLKRKKHYQCISIYITQSTYLVDECFSQYVISLF